jgi:hypothetical protein
MFDFRVLYIQDEFDLDLGLVGKEVLVEFGDMMI